MASNMAVLGVSDTGPAELAQGPETKRGELTFAPACTTLSVAEWTGLEPATPGVTGRYSNQLNYHSW